MERLIHFEPLTEAEANFFGSLEQYFFAEFPNKKIQELFPMQCMHRDEGWYYNFLDKIILIDDSGKPSYIPKLNSTKNRDVTYQEIEAMLYAIENDCTYGLYKDGVFSFCGSNVRIVKESGEFIELPKVRILKTIGLVCRLEYLFGKVSLWNYVRMRWRDFVYWFNNLDGISAFFYFLGVVLFCIFIFCITWKMFH